MSKASNSNPEEPALSLGRCWDSDLLVVLSTTQKSS